MHVQFVEGWDDFNQLRGEWDTIYEADPEAHFFLSWQWLADWLTVNPTPWFVLAAKRDEISKGYVGFLPMRNQLRFDKDVGFFNHVTLAGAQYSDYTGILVRPEFETEALRAFARYVKRELNWARFTLENFMILDRRRRIFLSAFDKPKFTQDPIDYHTSDGTDHSICPSVNLPLNWDDYLATLSTNNRQKIRRLMRKVDASKECHIELADAQTYDRYLKVLLDFWKIKWAPSKGEMASIIAARNYDMLIRCAEHGTLLLPVFFDGDRPVAALAIVIDTCKRSLLFLITGRDETYTAMPAGYLLHAYSIRHAIAHGFTSYDFCKGNEDYKYLFGARDRHLNPVAVRTVSGRNLSENPDPSWVPTMLSVTLDFENTGAMADAELGYRQILEVAPDNALALFRYGRFLAQTGAYGQAKRLLLRSVEIEPGGDNAWFWLARSHQSLGENDAALEACRKAVFLHPENEEAKALLLRLGVTAKAASQTPLLAARPVTALGAAAAPVDNTFDAADVLRRLGVEDPKTRFKI